MKLILIQLTLIFSIFFFKNTKTAFVMKNKYMAEVENILTCPNNDKLETPLRNLKYQSYNRTYKTLSYDFTFHRPIDAKVGGVVIADRWGDGGWINIPFFGFQPDICRYMLRFFRSAWIDTYTNAGVPHPDQCPIPAGNYSVKNYHTDTSKFTFPFFSGRFRFTSLMKDVDTKKDIYCLIHIIKVSEIF